MHLKFSLKKCQIKPDNEVSDGIWQSFYHIENSASKQLSVNNNILSSHYHSNLLFLEKVSGKKYYSVKYWRPPPQNYTTSKKTLCSKQKYDLRFWVNN